jgi:phosphatidylserine/phosphatidylglycerophosphate/cardiolipin synthase-like enzyme
VIKSLAGFGTTIHIATRPDTHNLSFIDQFQEGPERGKIQIHIVDKLHEKGIVTDSFYLGGSMNFTYNGITFNEEAVIYATDQQIVAGRRLIFKDHWGGEI